MRAGSLAAELGALLACVFDAERASAGGETDARREPRPTQRRSRLVDAQRERLRVPRPVLGEDGARAEELLRESVLDAQAATAGHQAQRSSADEAQSHLAARRGPEHGPPRRDDGRLRETMGLEGLPAQRPNQQRDRSAKPG